MIHKWWSDKPNEHYWLEVTGRKDLGANLKAPQTNEKNKEFWSYSLLNYVNPGDVIFHYDRPNQSIVGRSTAIGEVWEDDIIWAARGTSARTAGIQPHPRRGWYMGLERFTHLDEGVKLKRIRNEKSSIIGMVKRLAKAVGEPLYFPFELGEKRPLRPMQGYLFKLPGFFVNHFSGLSKYQAYLPQTSISAATKVLGASYRPADEATSVGKRDPFSVDPALVERALRGHALTQNALAAYLHSHGIDPRSPSPDEPNFDLAWTHQGINWVAEVKSLTKANEEKQLRLGLGQLLRYRQLLSTKGLVRAVLVAERQPSDSTWEALCAQIDVLLVWPDSWQTKLHI